MEIIVIILSQSTYFEINHILIDFPLQGNYIYMDTISNSVRLNYPNSKNQINFSNMIEGLKLKNIKK